MMNAVMCSLSMRVGHAPYVPGAPCAAVVVVAPDGDP